MTVYLVGAGPGDPGLLTVRGAEVLQRADVVVFDRLSVRSLLDLAPEEAERISVGKSAGSATLSQDEINDLLVERGEAGEEVVRLKGGDPFVFARGGEEAAALEEAGVPYEVVPGVTSAIAAPAYAGIPLTLRHSSTSFTVVTGHEAPDADASVDWEAVARVGGTVVILMGVARIAEIAERLVKGGRSPDTPVAAVRWGTRPDQTTVRATLATIADEELEPPSTIVVGEVARRRLSWFESRPLLGRQVVVTRPRQQAPELVRLLHDLGAEAVEVPAIRIAEPADGGVALHRAADDLGPYDWIVVTSVNGARRLLDALPDVRGLAGLALAAIGPGTAAVLEGAGIQPDLVPSRFVAEGLLDEFPDAHRNAGRILLPRAAVARAALAEGLRDKGWEVDIVEAYRTVAGEPDEDALERARGADAICFTSSSTVTRYLDVAGEDAVPPVVACIGPVTARTARDSGLEVDVEATEHTIPGLVHALVEHYTSP